MSSKVSHVVLGHFEIEDYDDIVFTAYRPDDPYDVLTETMIGCGRAIKDDMAAVWFDVGNFATPWADGDRVLVLVEALRHGTDRFATVDITLNRTIDIQDVGEIMLTTIPQLQQRTGMVEWDGIDNECIVGYSVYQRDKRFNETIVAVSNYEYSGIVSIRPVFVDGFETVYSSNRTHGSEQGITKTAFALSKNPSYSRLTIDYQISQTGHVCLNVFDISGRLVKTVLNSIHTPGYYSTVLDGTDVSGRAVPAGIYFVRLVSPDFARTQKSILLR